MDYIKAKATQSIQEMEERYNHLRNRRVKAKDENSEEKKLDESDGRPKSTIVRMRFRKFHSFFYWYYSKS